MCWNIWSPADSTVLENYGIFGISGPTGRTVSWSSSLEGCIYFCPSLSSLFLVQLPCEVLHLMLPLPWGYHSALPP